MKNIKFHTVRQITTVFLILFFFALPFWTIGGRSVLRFDIGSLQLFFFGVVIPLSDFFIVLIAAIFLTFFTLFVTNVFGRVWCGWFCPQTVLLDAVSLFTGKPDTLTSRLKSTAARVLLSGLAAGFAVLYFVQPHDIPLLVARGGTAAHIIIGSWVSLAVLLYADVGLLGRKFCATVCPYAKLQSVLFDDRTLLIAFERSRADECMGCNACVRACPVGIDIRKGSHMACIHCAECVDACTERMALKKRKSLIGYFFGDPGLQKKGKRLVPLLTGGLSLLFLFLLIYISATRMPFDMNVRLNLSAGSTGTNGGTINAYEISFTNTSPQDLVLELSAQCPDGAVSVSPGTVTIPRGPGVTRVEVKMTLKNTVENIHTTTVTFSASSPALHKVLSKKIYFVKQE